MWLDLRSLWETQPNNLTLSIEPGSISVDGQSVALALGLATTEGGITLAGQSTTLALGVPLSGSGLTLAGQSFSFATGVALTNGSITIQGQSVVFGPSLPLSAGSITLQGQSINFGLGVALGTGDITLQGQTLPLALSVPLSAGAMTLAGQSITTALGLAFGSGTLSFDGQGITLSLAGALALSIEPGAIGITGQDLGLTLTQVSTQPGPVDSPRIAEGFYRRKKRRKPLELPEPVFISPASFERAPPQAVIDKVPDFTTLAQTLGEAPAALSARIDREIEFLMRERAERDDEEALVLILTALD